MKIIQQGTTPNGYTIKVYSRNEYGDYAVKVFKDKKYLGDDSTYYTDSKDDAMGTAAIMFEHCAKLKKNPLSAIGAATIGGLVANAISHHVRKKKKNPPASTAKPKRSVHRDRQQTELYDNIIEIKAQKGKKSLWPGELFQHDFKGKKTKILGNPDGSLTVKPPKGVRLWKHFDYDKGDL